MKIGIFFSIHEFKINPYKKKNYQNISDKKKWEIQIPSESSFYHFESPLSTSEKPI